MSQTKPEHPPENTPTIDAEEPTDSEWKRKNREDIKRYETNRVSPGPVDSERVKAYKKQTDEAGRKVMELLSDHPGFREVFRERIRFAVAPYDDYERQREEEDRRQTKQRGADLAAAERDPKRRDKNAKPPSEAYSWVQSEGCWMRRFAHADISPAPWLQAILDREGFDDPSKWLPAYYGILAAIHDKHPDCRRKVTQSLWPPYLLDHVWRLLDPLHGLPAATIQDAWAAVAAVASGTTRKPEIAERKPLGAVAALIYERLKELPEHRGMDTAALLDWLADRDAAKAEGREPVIVDEGTLRGHLKQIEPYGLKNARRIGYYVR